MLRMFQFLFTLTSDLPPSSYTCTVLHAWNDAYDFAGKSRSKKVKALGSQVVLLMRVRALYTQR